MKSLYLCGIRLELSGDVPDCLWSAEVGSFRTIAPYTHSHRLHFRPMQDRAEAVDPVPGFTYRRHDLVFTTNGHVSELRHDGGQAAALAGLELALSQAVRALGGYLLHASAGVIHEECWVMPGPSGTGKSTAARGGFDWVLSDERVAIIPDDDGGYRVWPTPFWSDGRTLAISTESAPLAAIARLRKGKRAQQDTVERASMVAWLLRSIVLYDVAEGPQVQALEFACAVVASARCVELEFPKEGQWVTSLMNPIGLAS